MLYVAYGSNLNKRQMHKRCPGARVVGTGVIKDYQLNFRGSCTGNYLTIDRNKDHEVPVAVWDITQKDKVNLDRYEGYPTFYRTEEIKVYLKNGKVVKALVYIMNSGRPIGVPHKYYTDICLEGCKDFEITTDYLVDAYFRAQEAVEVSVEMSGSGLY